ncbi:ISL3 family transposase, partial [Sporosarcina siberiensis]
KLSFTPTHCDACGIVNQNYTIYKNGTQTSRITLPFLGMYPAYLLLKKQRFMCKACQHSFTAQTSVVKKNCYISQNVKSLIVIKASEARSIKSIARDCSVSSSTIQRQINETAKLFKSHHQALPENLSFDEFKYAKGKMAFEYINAMTGDILDILDQRNKLTIKNHFITNYSLADRKCVKTVTIDMNAGYASVIKELFPNAEIIIDRFHLVQLINRSMNKCRIQVMNQLSKSNGEDLKKYRRLKAFWKLLLKNATDISSTEYKYYRLFGQRTESGIIEEMLTYSPVLKANYDLYQSLLKAMRMKDFETLKFHLAESVNPLISGYMRTSLKTLRGHLSYIENSFIY